MADTQPKMKFLNNIGSIPKLNGPPPVSTINGKQFTELVDGTKLLPIFWIEGQAMSEAGGNYNVPGAWAYPYDILKIPQHIRMMWETSDIQIIITFWISFTGIYTYGIHPTHFDFDIIPKENLIIPGHVHAVSEYPGFGIIAYGQTFEHSFEGDTDLATSFGSYSIGVPCLVREAFAIYREYVTTDSPAQQIVEIVWHFFVPMNEDSSVHIPDVVINILPPTTDHAFGPTSFGCTDYNNPHYVTGQYTIDGVSYGLQKTIGEYAPVIIPVGFKRPPKVPKMNPGNQPDVWYQSTLNIRDYIVEISPFQPAADDPANTERAFKALGFEGLQKMTGIDDWLSVLCPNKIPFFGSAILNIVILAKPRPSQPPNLIELLKAAYTSYATYITVVFVDTGFWNDCGFYLYPDDYNICLTLITGLCDELKDHGFIYGGEVDYKYPAIAEALIRAYIDDFNTNYPQRIPGVRNTSVFKPDGSQYNPDA